MWDENNQTIINGETITWGPCKDDRYKGKYFVSIGSKYNHTTFIVSSDYATIHAIKSRGADKDIWRTLAIAILNS